MSLDVDSGREISLVTAHKTQQFALLGGQFIARARSVRLTITSTIENYEFSYILMLEGNWQERVVLGSVSATELSGDDFTAKSYPARLTSSLMLSRYRLWNLC